MPVTLRVNCPEHAVTTPRAFDRVKAEGAARGRTLPGPAHASPVVELRRLLGGAERDQVGEVLKCGAHSSLGEHAEQRLGLGSTSDNVGPRFVHGRVGA